MKKCVILEIEDKADFENQLNKYISSGYKIESSSCNSKYYKAILVFDIDYYCTVVSIYFFKILEQFAY